MTTFHERFLQCVKVSTVYPTDFANSKQLLLKIKGLFFVFHVNKPDLR